MARIMTEMARDIDGSPLGLSLSTQAGRIDVRTDGSFFMEAPALLEIDDLVSLRSLIDEALRRAGQGRVKV